MSQQYRPDSIYMKLRGQLYEGGLFEKEADAVMQRHVAADAADGGAMGERWGDSVSGYPKSLMGALWVATKAHAVQWIDENAPKHWARGMFLSDNAQEETPPSPR